MIRMKQRSMRSGCGPFGTKFISMKQLMRAFALVVVGFLAACGGSSSDGNPSQCPEGQTGVPPDCVPPSESDATDEEPTPNTDDDNGPMGPTPSGPTSPGAPSPGGPGGTTGPTNGGTPASGTYESLQNRILAAANPSAVAATLDRMTLTLNQYNTLFELALVLDPAQGSSDPDKALARQVVAATNWRVLDALGIDLTTVDPALANLYTAHRAELVTQEAVRSAFLAINRRADVLGDYVPSTTALGMDLPPDSADLYYAVWMNPLGVIHRWKNPSADKIYSADEIRMIAAENRIGSFVAGRAQASYSGTATGFAAHTDETAGEMTADVALTLAFGIDAENDDARDVAPSLTGTIDNFRLVGQTGDLGWTAIIDGDFSDADSGGGTVDSAAISTGKPPYLVGNVNGLDVAFFTDQVKGTGMMQSPLKSHPPTHAAGSFDLTFRDGRAVGAFAIPKD